MTRDPFQEFRKSTAHYSSVTAPDGRTLTLTAIDAARFYNDAHQVIQLAAKVGWRVAELRHSLPGANVERLTVTLHR